MTAAKHFNLETDVHKLFAAKLRAFAEFCAENWLMADGEALNPTIDAMTSGLDGALEHWLDELGYAR